MAWIRSVAREVWGLFVDDGSFAVAILAWLLVVLIGWRTVTNLHRFGGVALALGLCFVLIENVLRYARRITRK